MARAIVRYIQGVKAMWSLARRFGFEALVVVAAIEGAVEVALRHDSPDAPATALWLALPATAILGLPLLARRRLPFAAPAAVWLLAVALSFLDGQLVVFPASTTIIGLFASFLLGYPRSYLEARLGLAVVVAGALAVVYNNPEHPAAALVFVPLMFFIGWLAGFALRGQAQQAEAAEARAAQAEHERATAARIAVAEERARIARELHDIVAHSVSVMVLQVGAVRHKLPDTMPEDADALRGVEHTGRAALAEMRRLLGALRRAGDDLELAPQPGLDNLESLAEETRRAGLPVQLHVEGTPVPLPPAIDLSAYRIIQEGLTNALKHARARNADVTLRHRAGELEIEVRDDGDGNARSDGFGHGLIGIGERVKIYGGEMSAGIAAGGGFILSARLPLSGDRS